MSRCPICGSSGVCDFFPKSGRTLLICESCRHVWWDFFPAADELREYYRRQYTKTHGQEDIQAKARHYYKEHLQALLQTLGSEAAECAICDYGCSIPVLVTEAKQAGFRRALGVDYCDEVRRYASEHGVEVLAPEELARIPDGSLDIVRFSHTLEHCTDPTAVLQSVLPKLRPGGLIYITQPNFPVFRFGPSTQDLKDTVYPEHLHFFSPISLLEMVRGLALQPRRFFTHQNEEQVVSAYQEALDVDYARRRLADYESLGETSAHPLGNYPYYAGENSVLYAFKPVL